MKASRVLKYNASNKFNPKKNLKGSNVQKETYKRSVRCPHGVSHLNHCNKCD